MQRNQKILSYSEKILELFQNNARRKLTQSQLRKVFGVFGWHNYQEDVLNHLATTKQMILMDNNYHRFSLTDKGNDYLNSKYGTLEDKISILALKVMPMFIKNDRKPLRLSQIQDIYSISEWSIYHYKILEYLIEKMGWVSFDIKTNNILLTSEGNIYLDKMVDVLKTY
jgi:hypothetical protein